jgi:hypothetical protein
MRSNRDASLVGWRASCVRLWADARLCSRPVGPPKTTCPGCHCALGILKSPTMTTLVYLITMSSSVLHKSPVSAILAHGALYTTMTSILLSPQPVTMAHTLNESLEAVLLTLNFDGILSLTSIMTPPPRFIVLLL